LSRHLLANDGVGVQEGGQEAHEHHNPLKQEDV
jgi:hypothetical protein